MKDPYFLLFVGVIGLYIVVSVVSWLLGNWHKAKKYDQLQSELSNLDLRKAELEYEKSHLQRERSEWDRKVQRDLQRIDKLAKDNQRKWEKKVKADTKAINTLAEQKSQGFSWLAEAYADYFYLQDLEEATFVAHKSHPARKAAQHIREMAARRRIAERLYRILKYQLVYYENLFPWLIEFKGEDIDDLIKQILSKKQKGESDEEEPDDPAKKWLTAAEYEKLPKSEKFQLALDRYWQKKKTRWEIGRDYERYIGYRYESNGYSVYYQGIIEGLADLGRDLIATKDSTVEVVQCKCWSQRKRIHEKHIFQLYGTVIAYKIDHPRASASGSFVTSTKLSDRARQFADELRIKIIEDLPLDHYPCVKCNVSRRDGSKIYHLPFDQQYDRTVIEEERNECYVETVKEAEELGFRHAFRWRGEPAE